MLKKVFPCSMSSTDSDFFLDGVCFDLNFDNKFLMTGI